MDIYIGGVPDRNRALHGDVVAALINPKEKWKILYSQLDAYLDEHINDKALVNMPDESNTYSDNASTSSSKMPDNIDNHLINVSKELKCNVNDISDLKDKSALKANADQSQHSCKKKKKRRGKKKKQAEAGPVSSAAASELAVEPKPDSIEVISCPSKEEVKQLSGISSTDGSSKVVIVPPHELSGCELSDDESVNSLTFDLEDKLILQPATPVCMKNETAMSKGLCCDNLLGKDSISSLNEKCSIKVVGNDYPEFKDDSKHEQSHSQSTNNSRKAYEENKAKWKREDLKTKKYDNDNAKSRPTIEQVLKLPNWEKFVQKTARVVLIMERKHSLVASGVLKQFADKNPNVALFSPFDGRIPRIKIPTQSCPPDFMNRPADYSKIIYMAKIIEWNDPKFALGIILREVGQLGDLDAEIESLLLEHGIDYGDFPEKIMECLPPLPWSIPPEEVSRRLDLRGSLIFTIDPSTARDLDDALSYFPLQSGNFRVGIHIADVSYFVGAGTPLDHVASQRATSVYLTHKVIPMLPRALCEDLCSLNPYEDRLTFTALFELSPKAEIVSEWFGRSVIRSRAKLSYDEAQKLIDGIPFTPDAFPGLAHDSSIVDHVRNAVCKLHDLATHLRERRFNNGALRLDQTKIGFRLDALQRPVEIVTEEIRDSNRLVEEFMLLANIAVANKILDRFPRWALLRRHPPPHETQLSATVRLLREYGFDLDATTSSTLHESLRRCTEATPDAPHKMQLVVNMCSKPMQLARYFCAGTAAHPDAMCHYALSVPCYTHFTSPIRRYADIVVHRLLAAAVEPEGATLLPPLSEVLVERIAARCNDCKQSAKAAQEAGGELFLAALVRSAGEMREVGVVLGVLDRSVDVLLPALGGVIKRCYAEQLSGVDAFRYNEFGQRKTLTLCWKADAERRLPPFEQPITFFDGVSVALRPAEGGVLKFNAFLLRPDDPANH